MVRLSPSTSPPPKAKASSRVTSTASMKKFLEPSHHPAPNLTSRPTTLHWAFDSSLNVEPSTKIAKLAKATCKNISSFNKLGIITKFK